MIERHHDYILEIPFLASGANVIAEPLQLDTDAPFLLRGRGIRIAPPTSTRAQTNVQLMRFRYKNQAGEYLAQIPLVTPQDFQFAYGQGGNYKPVYPEQPYPPGGTIEVDLYNDGPDATNVQIIFRGVKIFRDGAFPDPTYPAKCRALDFTYQSGKGTPTDAALILQPTGAGSELRQMAFNTRSDADFVLRGGQAGNWDGDLGDGGLYSTFGYTELFIQLMDANLKPYSNVPIHIDWLFGNAGGNAIPGEFLALGNSAPGLFVPEIYLPKNSIMFFDLIRRDGPYIGVTDALPVRISIAWIGSKVYAQ